MENKCLHCLEKYNLEVLEAWNGEYSKDFMVDSCCEGAYQEWLFEYQNTKQKYNNFEALTEFAIQPLKDAFGVKRVYRDFHKEDIWFYEPTVKTDAPQKEVKEFINKHHRHLGASLGDKCRVVVRNGSHVIACSMMGRPVSRYLDDGKTLEITRVAVNNDLPKELTQNACSQVYSACRKWGKKNGYESVITYTLEDENGSSLKASNFIHEYTQPNNRRNQTWSSKGRVRNDEAPSCPKKRWRILCR